MFTRHNNFCLLINFRFIINGIMCGRLNRKLIWIHNYLTNNLCKLPNTAQNKTRNSRKWAHLLRNFFWVCKGFLKEQNCLKFGFIFTVYFNFLLLKKNNEGKAFLLGFVGSVSRLSLRILIVSYLLAQLISVSF